MRDLRVRLGEAARQGFSVAVVPWHRGVGEGGAPTEVDGMRVIEVRGVAEALDLLGIVDGREQDVL